MATTISTQDIIDAKRDIEDIGEAVNEAKIVSPRYGEDFKSIPMLSAELQDAIDIAAAGGAGANGWTDLLIQTADGSTQRAKNELFQSQISGKANKTYVDAQDLLKADKSYVDAQDASLQSQINQKATAAYLDSALAEQTQTVNTALSQLSTQASKFYPTLAEANADIANITVNQPIQIGESGINGGLYYKATAEATTLTKSPYDPLTQAKTYTDSEIELFNTDLTEQSQNLYNKHTNISGRYINTSGGFSSAAGWSISDYIPVVAGESYTISSADRRVGLAFYTADRSYIAGSFNDTKDVTLVAPPTAAFLVINVDSTTVTGSDIQVELGTEATEYAEQLVVKESKLPMHDLFSRVKTLTDKPYEVVLQSKNIFDEANHVRNNVFLNSNGTGAISSATGWKCTTFIPVLPNTTYTLSGNRGRVGLQEYEVATSGQGISGTYREDTNPFSFTTTATTNYIVFNLQSAAVPTFSEVQLEEGSIATEYIPYGEEVTKIDPDFINYPYEPQNTQGNITLVSGVGNIDTYVDDLKLTHRVEVFNNVTQTASSVFNFKVDYLEGSSIRVCSDDVAPVRMMGYTIGANHGYAESLLTLSAHGKQHVDVGSVWSDGTKEWVITRIVSTSQLEITSRTDHTLFTLGRTLTHVSGATNTASFKPTAAATNQLYSALKNHSVKLLIDGELTVDTNTDKAFNKLSVLESYDLMEKSDMVEWLIQNGGGIVSQYNAASALNVSMNYTFTDDGCCVIPSNFFVYKDLSAANNLMFTQSSRLSAGNGDVLYYVPRTIPFTHESVNYDFSVPSSIEGLSIVQRINFGVDRVEVDAVLPDRLIMLNNVIGYAVGYLPILDASPDKRNSLTSIGMQISDNNAKVYPYLVDGLTTLNAGANYSCVAYRKYFKRTAGRTAEYVIPSDYGDFLFLDWHVLNKIDVIQLQENLVGRTFEVIEKSSNVTLLSEVATSHIAVKLGSGTNARLVLKFTL